MSAAWTKGPWRLDDETAHAGLIEGDYHFVDAGDGFHGGGDHGFGLCGLMSVGDARLVAAAPDLAEALEALLTEHMDLAGRAGELEWAEAEPSPVLAARAALAKARGEAIP